MIKIIETCIERIQSDNYCCISTGEKKFVTMIAEWAKQYPDDVIIKYINNDGSIMAHVPSNWFRFVKPPTKRSYTDEQRQAMSERMKKARETKINSL